MRAAVESILLVKFVESKLLSRSYMSAEELEPVAHTTAKMQTTKHMYKRLVGVRTVSQSLLDEHSEDTFSYQPSEHGLYMACSTGGIKWSRICDE